MKKLMLLFLGGLALLLILAVVLFLKNPAKSDFEAFLGKQDEKRREEMVKEKSGTGLISGLLKEVPRSAAASIERKEYHLFSIHTRKYSVLGVEGKAAGLPESEKYLGLLGTFFKLD